MKWSISTSRVFNTCQRKWYFSQIAASHGKKDTFRRELFLLKQLRSVFAWRGSLVDLVIEKMIVPELKLHRIPSESQVLTYASELIQKQLDFGKTLRFREQDMTKTKAGDDYAAFYDLEYKGKLNDDQIKTAIDEIKTSLQNLLKSELLEEIRSANTYVIAQRTLNHRFEDTSIICTPDLITFFSDRGPMIVDWKVHAFGTTEYWLQLGIYGHALTQVSPHKDFPANFQDQTKSIDKIRLIEYQLLNDQIREYSMTEKNIADIEDYIFTSIDQISRLVNGKKYKDLDSKIFETARFSNMCTRCGFKKICWSGDEYE